MLTTFSLTKIMTLVDFEELVERAQEFRKSRPVRHWFFLRGLMTIGQLFLAMSGVISFLLFLGLGFLAFQTDGVIFISLLIAAILCLSLGISVVRSLRVHLDPPEGVVLAPSDAPKLFAELEEMRKKIRAPRLDAITLSADFNASVCRFPKKSIFGGWYHIITLGLPLLKALTPDQLRSVLAHELGHHSRKHGAFTARVYKLHATWGQLTDRLQQTRHWSRYFFKPFLDAFFPVFNAHTFIISREHEFEADRLAAEQTSPRVTAHSLCQSQVLGRYMQEKFWPSVYRGCIDHAEPPRNVLNDFAIACLTKLDEDQARKYLQKELKLKTFVSDTHPSLTDRLRALEQPPIFTMPSMDSAAEYFLGDNRRRYEMLFNEFWAKMVEPQWRHAYETAKDNRKRRQRLQQWQQRLAEVPPGLAVQLALIHEDLHEREESLKLLRPAAQAWPEHAEILYILGRMLLEDDDPEGVPLIKKAMELNPSLLYGGSELLGQFYLSEGDPASARPYLQNIDDETKTVIQAMCERMIITHKDELEPVDAEEWIRQDILEQIENLLPNLNAEIYLAAKKMKYYQAQRQYILGLRHRWRWWQFNKKVEEMKHLELLANELYLPGPGNIVWLRKKFARWRRQLRKMPGARLNPDADFFSKKRKSGG